MAREAPAPRGPMVPELSKKLLSQLLKLEEGLRIDKASLDKALLEQPELYYHVSKQLADLVSQRDAAKQYISEVEARVDATVRKSLAEAETKATVDQISAAKQRHPDVRDAVDAHLDLSHAVGQFGALKEAFTQRSYVLKDMVSLYISNYYSDSMGKQNSDRVRNLENDSNHQRLRDARERK